MLNDQVVAITKAQLIVVTQGDVAVDVNAIVEGCVAIHFVDGLVDLGADAAKAFAVVTTKAHFTVDW